MSTTVLLPRKGRVPRPPPGFEGRKPPFRRPPPFLFGPPREFGPLPPENEIEVLQQEKDQEIPVLGPKAPEELGDEPLKPDLIFPLPDFVQDKRASWMKKHNERTRVLNDENQFDVKKFGPGAPFLYSGFLPTFNDGHIPYELERAEVLPYTVGENGERFYYAGIYKKTREIGGFGGQIEGRLTKSHRRNKFDEDPVKAAFRELHEESLGVFNNFIDNDQLVSTEFFVVGNILLLLLPVNSTPAELKKWYRTIVKSRAFLTRCEQEMEGFAVLSSEEMQELTQNPVYKDPEGVPVWLAYHEIIKQWVHLYGVVL